MSRHLGQVVRAAALSALLLMAGSSAPRLLAGAAPADAGGAQSPAIVEERSRARDWLTATRAALDDAVEVRVPFARSDEFPEDGVAAFAFRALRGQMLELSLTHDAEDARIFVEIFRVVDVLGQPLRERLTGLRPKAQRLSTRLPSDGTYHVLVQTTAANNGRYRLTLELGAALPFPVVGARADAIRSLFGASRNGGRSHAGIDIFVQRLTPVLAVAAGRVTPSKDALGGNTVWLNTAGTSYYYAHLDRVAVKPDQAVKAGDVLGYVGNTGNAENVASHLHFGVYRWGRDPIDPLPLVVGQRFTGQPAATNAAGAGG